MCACTCVGARGARLAARINPNPLSSLFQFKFILFPLEESQTLFEEKVMHLQMVLNDP